MPSARHLITLPLLMAAACPAADVTWMVQEENDKFTNGNQDRYYTQGMRIAYMDDALSHWSVAQEINTPADQDSPNPGLDDLPYSALLYVSRGYGFLFPRQQAMASIEAKLGVVGPLALGRQIQNGFHHLIGATEYAGWDTQMPNELAFSVSAEVRRRFYLDAPEVHHWDIIAHAGAELGNIRASFITGAQIRFGLLDDSWGHGFMRQSTAWVDHVGSGGPREAWWWLFAGFSAEVNAHVYATDGTSFSQSRSVDSRPVVVQGELGISLRLASGSFSFAIAHRSREFEAQAGSHAFGSLRYAYIF